jgi:hypothetical protein
VGNISCPSSRYNSTQIAITMRSAIAVLALLLALCGAANAANGRHLLIGGCCA